MVLIGPVNKYLPVETRLCDNFAVHIQTVLFEEDCLQSVLRSLWYLVLPANDYPNAASVATESAVPTVMCVR